MPSRGKKHRRRRPLPWNGKAARDQAPLTQAALTSHHRSQPAESAEVGLPSRGTHRTDTLRLTAGKLNGKVSMLHWRVESGSRRCRLMLAPLAAYPQRCADRTGQSIRSEPMARDCGYQNLGLLHGNQVRHVQLQSAGSSRVPHARSRRTSPCRSSARGTQAVNRRSSSLGLRPISFLLSQVGADFGKRLEKGLWASWGGPPTTRFLRHGNHEFNNVTRRRVHAKLRELGLHVPTREEQEQDPCDADTYYESCTQELIRRTRDTGRFPLVFKGLTEYGFRRNLLGLKIFGMSLTVAGVAGSAWSTYTAWTPTNELPAVSLVAGLISVGLLLAWLVWLTKRTVEALGRPICPLPPRSRSGAGIDDGENSLPQREGGRLLHHRAQLRPQDRD